MVTIRAANNADRVGVESLIADYHTFEEITPNMERISWAVDQAIGNYHPGVLLVAEDEKEIIGVSLAVYSPSAELGRVLVVNDFYVHPSYRRKGVGKSMAEKLVDEAKQTHTDHIDLEVLRSNPTAAMFWKSLGFEGQERTIYRRKLRTT